MSLNQYQGYTPQDEAKARILQVINELEVLAREEELPRWQSARMIDDLKRVTEIVDKLSAR